ncbi:hypothetical protein [uncultured Algoriphagus sp.]|uniref:hypothetical protein n=1 Tax=uncultured Algoriphagus sp. TaxID=417365 RepID=UPI002586F72A|nr:hypothetical protein [uncultured Algoriphagus sp.]
MNIGLALTEEVAKELENLSALGYSLEDMALYFDVDKIYFIQAAEDPESKVGYYIRRGKLMAAAKEQLALLQATEGGNVTASEHLAKIRRNKSWEISKLDIFGGFEEKHLLENLNDYIQSGSLNGMKNEEAIYMEALLVMAGMGRKYGRRNAVAFFTKRPFNLKYARASEMYDEAVNLFYADRQIERKAMRHKLAEQLQEAAIIVRDNAASAKDWEVYGNLIVQASRMLGLDKDDPEKPPAEQFAKPIRYYSLSPGDVGLHSIDRQDVARQIEALEIPERDKIRVRQDARIEYINLEERLHELEEDSQPEES